MGIGSGSKAQTVFLILALGALPEEARVWLEGLNWFEWLEGRIGHIELKRLKGYLVNL